MSTVSERRGVVVLHLHVGIDLQLTLLSLFISHIVPYPQTQVQELETVQRRDAARVASLRNQVHQL